MISLLNPVNYKEIPVKVSSYEFDFHLDGSEDSIDTEGGIRELTEMTEFLEEEELIEEFEADNVTDIEEEVKEEVPSKSLEELRAEEVIREAEEQAAEIIATARRQAAEIETEARDTGYQEGLSAGRQIGEEEALKETNARFEKDEVAFLQELQIAMSELETRKEYLLEKYINDLCDLVLTIAEKVIKISLKTSSEVIKNMILAATEKNKNKEWARIHISNHDAALMVHEDVDLLEMVQQISPLIKVIVMESEEPGECIIEFPDQIIDAGVSTQLENIKELVKENRFHGGQ